MKFDGLTEVGVKQGMLYFDLCSLSTESLIEKMF